MNVATASAAPAKRLGRFELKRVLGRGAQATVWLGYDARLDREVAVKLLASGADAQAVLGWLNEARAVSRLNHPNIVPVFEADEQQGQSYLVFEYVKGPTLAELLRQRPSLPPKEAAEIMLGVLDALRTAHDSGIVHRDLKPSNILIDAGQRPRVMDFGIAARVSDAHDERIYGTPGYISPEAARGQAPMPAMDVFAAGVMLAEMLSGKPMLRESDPYKAIDRVQKEVMLLPTALPLPVDATLRGIVDKAMARDPADRYNSAALLHAALARWLNPDAAPETTPGGSAGNSTLDFLLRRMKHKTDFPAMSDSVGRIQRVANSEHESVASLSDAILKDVALTNKLLRMVNTAHFSAAGGAVSTVSRAVSLVGFAGIRNMALSLVLLEHMPDKGHASQLKEEFLRSLMAGALAAELSGSSRDGEEAFLSAMFQGLGRLLTEFYFPEEAQQIRALVRPAGKPTAPPPSEDVAAQRILGISFEELGLGIARAWGLPDNLQRAMRKPGPEAPAKPAERGVERQRWLGQAANEVAEALLHAENPQARIADIGARFSRVLGIDARELKGAAELAQQRLSQMAQAMNLQVKPSSRAQRLLTSVLDPVTDDTLSPHQLHATLPLEGAAGRNADVTRVLEAVAPPVQVAEMLAAGIQDITNHMVSDGFKLNEVLRMILETMLRALDFRTIVFALRDPKTETLTGRFGLGEGAQAVAAALKVPLRQPGGGGVPDLFTAVCLKGADTLIADATVPNIAARLPAWFRQQINAPAFLLLPLTMKNAPFGLIYADKAVPGGIELGEKELNLLRTLRNQAVMAFRQAS